MPSSVPTNAVVERLLEKDTDEPIELRGYPGPNEEDEPVRIYRDLTLERCVEVPQEAVLDVIEADNPRDPSVIFLDNNTTLNYTIKKSISNSTSSKVSLSVPVREIKRTAQTRTLHSQPERFADISNQTLYAIAMRRGGRNYLGGGGNLVELPDMWCEIGCEQRLNMCPDSYGFWCWLEYYYCRYECIIQG